MQLWHSVVRELRLEGVNFVPYSLRRGGATTAYRNGETLDVLVTKGRWLHLSTARIYLDCGSQSLIQLTLPSSSKAPVRAGVKAFFANA